MRPSHCAVWLIAILGSSCVGTEIGNPPTPTDATVSVDVLAVDDAELTVPIGLTVATGIEVDRAVLLVGDLRFRRQDTCSEQGVDHTDGFVSELLEAGVELEDIKLPTGSYCRVDVRPRRGGAQGFASEFPELDGLTAYAEGTFQGTPFVVRHEGDDELEFAGQFDLPAGEQVIFLAVDLAIWFDGLDLSAAETNAEGQIVIGHEGSFNEQLKANFERSVSVALDANGDRMLTAEDHDEDDTEVE